MKIAVLGCGNVGGALAGHLQRLGHDVVVAASTSDSDSLRKLLAANSALRAADAREAVEQSELVLLATPFHVAGDAVKSLAEGLKGKVLVDCTNPVGAGLVHGLGSRQSGTEQLQALVPATPVVKAFTIYGYENFRDSASSGRAVRPAMLYCGADAAAKAKVAQLLQLMGWDPVDVGGLDQALHLEHLTLLWIKMVRVGGRSSRLVWAKLDT